jgi:hypothetical protein
VYDSADFGFASIDSGRVPAPDETTTLDFRHLPRNCGLWGRMLDVVNLRLDGKGIRILQQQPDHPHL